MVSIIPTTSTDLRPFGGRPTAGIGGGYLAERAERYGARHLRIILIGGVVAIIVALALHPALGVMPVLVAAALARPVSRKLRRVRERRRSLSS